jgi:hypothetical protein
MPPSSPPLALAPALGLSRALYVTGEDHLRLTTFNSAASVELTVESRQLDITGRVVASGDRHVPTTDRTTTSTLIRLTEGWLLDAIVRATAGTPRRGQCFALLELVRGFSGAVVPVALLAQGYVTDTSRFGFPNSPIGMSTEGPGVLRSIAGTDPAANVEISESVPTNARWLVHAIRFTLVTDATAANREVAITYDDGTTVYARIPSRVTHVASTTIAYTSMRDAALETVAQDTERLIRLPWLVLQGGHRIRTVTTNSQATDNYSAPQLLVEEWIED